MAHSRPYILFFVLTACSPQRSTYIGEVIGSETWFAVVTTTENEVEGHVLGLGETIDALTVWFDAPLQSNTWLAHVDDGTVSGTLVDQDAGGIVDLGEEIWHFSATETREPIEDLYRAEDPNCPVGVIVRIGPTGEPELAGTWCNSDGDRVSVTAPEPISLTADGGIDVTATDGLTQREFTVYPVGH